MPDLRQTQTDVSAVVADTVDPLRFTEAAASVLVAVPVPLRMTEETADVVIGPHPPLRQTEVTVNVLVPHVGGVVVPWHLFFNTDLGAF